MLGFSLGICLLAAASGGAAGDPVTAGWENVDPARTEVPPVKVVWTAPADGFTVAREDGAEGEVVVSNGVIRIVKRNDRGRIVVTAPAFGAEEGRTIRLFADVAARSASTAPGRGWVGAYGATRSLSFSDRESRKWLVGGGVAMTTLVNSAPGMTYRKYTHFTPDGAPVTPFVVVEGAPSDSIWRGWTAEDLAASQPPWDARFARLSMPDCSGERQDSAAFERALAADVDHTAEVRSVGGRSALFVDGEEVPPVLYRTSEWEVAGRLSYAGKPLQRAGVRLGVINLLLGKLPTVDGPWSARGFDVGMAVGKIRDALRVGDESCFVLAIGTSAYPEFSAAHPDETWRKEDGSVVRGNSGSAIPDEYNDGGRPDPGDRRWPWMSYCSPAWRAAIRRNVEILFGELRRQGLLKRIVGVQFFGYHDGQFAVPIPDCSEPAKAAHRRYLAERGLKEGDPGAEYASFMKQIGFLALEDFSRAAKRAAGKPIIAMRWCMSPFSNEGGAYDVGAFLRSDAVDVIVPQPTYPQRLPGLSQGVRLPCASLHRHGKLMAYEFDLRTWAALDRWAHSVVETKGLGQADDLGMWKTIFRKHAGIMMAQRMGWWFYDMGGGWFRPDGIVDDVAEVMAVRRELMRTPPDPWHPDAALVVDELAMSLYNRPGQPKVPDAASLVMGEWPRVAVSGVPYDFYHVDDLLEDPSLARRYKAIALCGFLHPDASRRALMKRLADDGVKTFVVQPGGYSPEFFNGFVREAGGYVATRPGVMQVDMNGDFVSVHCLVPGNYGFRLPFPAEVRNLKSGRIEPTADGTLRLSLTAGETCWFRLRRIGM